MQNSETLMIWKNQDCLYHFKIFWKFTKNNFNQDNSFEGLRIKMSNII